MTCNLYADQFRQKFMQKETLHYEAGLSSESTLTEDFAEGDFNSS